MTKDEIHSEMETLIRQTANYFEYLPAILERGKMTGHAGNCTIIHKRMQTLIRELDKKDRDNDT